MKKIRFNNSNDLKRAIPLLEKANIDFTWNIFNYQHEVYLGHVNVDHVKVAMQGIPVPYKIVDYYQ